MQAMGSFEMSVPMYQTTVCHLSRSRFCCLQVHVYECRGSLHAAN